MSGVRSPWRLHGSGFLLITHVQVPIFLLLCGIRFRVTVGVRV